MVEGDLHDGLARVALNDVLCAVVLYEVNLDHGHGRMEVVDRG
jgi:hypothetical protein